jgi:hypothetical protein
MSTLPLGKEAAPTEEPRVTRPAVGPSLASNGKGGALRTNRVTNSATAVDAANKAAKTVHGVIKPSSIYV